MTACTELLAFADRPDPLRPALALATLEDLQIEAANERFGLQQKEIPALARRAAEVGIDRLRTRADIVPLLFSHATYKSYPGSFIARGRWDRLLVWLSTVSAVHPSDVDFAGVGDIDAWIDRLDARGHHLIATSGTSGKQSFLVMDDEDVRSCDRLALALFAYPDRVIPAHDRPVSLLLPARAAMRYAYAFRGYLAEFARPGAAHALTDEPMRVADTMRDAQVRRALADGSMSPQEVTAHMERAEQRRGAMDSALETLTDRILSYRDEPQIALGPWATWWRVMEIARRQGIGDGTFHPETVASIRGGLKGLALPADYEAQMAQFLGPVRRPKLYGMSEVASGLPMCEHGLYHCPPWLMLFILDEAGEMQLEADATGWVTGRVAFYDPVWRARWGGIVSGDRATASFTRQCECGRPGPIVLDTVQRYSEFSAGGDDKLTCGGTIDQYIRGVNAE